MQKDFLPQGAEVSTEGVRYRVWAPTSSRVDVQIYSPGGEVEREVPLLCDSQGRFHGLDSKGRADNLYKFRLNGGESFPDPASRCQPQGVHGPSMVIDPKAYKWKHLDWSAPRFRDLVIYELHIGTFTPEGTFRSAVEKLEHVRRLGASAIEIMPIGEFPGNRNWGYDGAYLYAPARAYGHPDDLRALVEAAHGLGLAVILDVVYNHFGPDGNYLGCYIGEYLDEKAKTPWGGAIRYGDPEFGPLRDFVVANPVYWMREFHIDGFRLDATHAIVDYSPRHILKQLTSSIHEHGGFAVAEDARNESRLLLPQHEGGYGFDGVWADDFHHSVRVANTHEDESYLGDFSGSVGELVDTLRNGWHYRGQYSEAGQKKRGTESRHIPPEKFVHCISNHDQVGNRAFGERLRQSISREAYLASSALLCLSPYTPMLFMGQEWAASTPFLFFTDHNHELGKLITKGRREEFKEFKAFRDPDTRAKIPDPQGSDTFEASKLKWGELEHESKSRTLALHQACLALRNSEPAFRPSLREKWQVEELAGEIGALRVRSENADYLLLFDLTGGHKGTLKEDPICEPRTGSEWSVVLATSESRFGGSGNCAVDLSRMSADFLVPELIVLKC
ncbi:malto-oligosyltrehalose trehalohydrolase [Verrucomicrobiota bacterium sgz303538]